MNFKIMALVNLQSSDCLTLNATSSAMLLSSSSTLANVIRAMRGKIIQQTLLRY